MPSQMPLVPELNVRVGFARRRADRRRWWTVPYAAITILPFSVQRDSVNAAQAAAARAR